MAIAFSCACGRKISVPDEKAGRTGKCAQCGRVLTVPAASVMPSAAASGSHVSSRSLPPARPAAVPPAPAVAADGGIPFADDPHAVLRRPSATPGVAGTAGGVLAAPSMHATPALRAQPAAVARPAAAAPQVAAALRPAGIRRHLYWVLLLVLIPLGWTTLHHSADAEKEFEQRLEKTIEGDPDATAKVVAFFRDKDRPHDKQSLCDLLPGDRVAGSLLPERTWMHWAFAGISGVVFLTAALLLFPGGHAKVTHLVGIGLMTGTLGIFLLLAFQWIAFHMPLFRGNGWVTLLLDLVWLIGQSYAMALGDHGFFLSFLGFTAGVGFCEEACKALPLLFRAAGQGFSSWRSAMLWGLISGIGFGVSEGISYSSDTYNGISGGGIYVVRFVSCVGLHGIWAAAVGIAIFRRQAFFKSVGHPLEWIWRTLEVVIVPMVLHGLYDTLLKQHFDAWALLVAVVSFAWLAYQIERAERAFGTPAAQWATA